MSLALSLRLGVQQRSWGSRGFRGTPVCTRPLLSSPPDLSRDQRQ